jgi:predicted ATPase
MPLNQIKVKGYKSIRDLDLTLTNLNVLIGANGAGKSNFVSLFELLNNMVEGSLQRYVMQKGGSESFLYYGQKVTETILIFLKFNLNYDYNYDYYNAYHCILAPTLEDRLIFEEENCLFHDCTYPRPYTEGLGSGHKESNLIEFSKNKKVVSYAYDNLMSWKVYHFHDTSDTAKVKRIGSINDNQYLRPDASNLAAFLYMLRNTDEEHYLAIRDAIRLVNPFFDDFLLRPIPGNEDFIRLEWHERGSDYPFLAHHLSDGTLRFICLAVLLLQPRLPSTILVDEPELGLHPYAIVVLASLIKSASERTQIIISTQSVSLVNQFDADNLLVVERNEDNGMYETAISRIDPQQLSSWLDEYSLGELWEKNVLGGRPH